MTIRNNQGSVFPKSTVFQKFKSLILQFFSIPLYWFSYFVPRAHNIWVFGAWGGLRYADNSRHLFEYLCGKEPGIRPVWLSRDSAIIRDLRASEREAYLIDSCKGFWISCRAGIVISSNGKADVNRPGISRAKKIQLWHGIPLKKIGLDDKPKDNSENALLNGLKRLISGHIFNNEQLFPFVAESWDIITATSPLIRERMATAFGVDKSRVVITGYPRNDILLSGKNEAPAVVRTVRSKNMVDRLILYAPTFRARYSDNAALFNNLDVAALEKCLLRCNAAFLVKMHPIFKNAGELLAGLAENSRIYLVKEEEAQDLNALLPSIDILITDYSGAYLDYLLLNRPIIFAPFDLQKYTTTDRELYEDYTEAAPGVISRNWEEVTRNICMICSGRDEFIEKRGKARQKYHTYTDADSSKRVVEVVREILKRRKRK